MGRILHLKLIYMIAIITAITCISFGNYCFAESIDIKEYSKQKVTIKAERDLDVYPENILILLTPDLVNKIIPELNNPRTMRITGIPVSDRNDFIEYGYSYVLKGDFDGDGHADLAFVGRYGDVSFGKQSFFSIISFKPGEIVRDLFMKIPKENIFLEHIPETDLPGGKIFLTYTPASDDCGFVYWKNGSFWYETCFDSSEYLDDGYPVEPR